MLHSLASLRFASIFHLDSPEPDLSVRDYGQAILNRARHDDVFSPVADNPAALFMLHNAINDELTIVCSDALDRPVNRTLSALHSTEQFYQEPESDISNKAAFDEQKQTLQAFTRDLNAGLPLSADDINWFSCANIYREHTKLMMEAPVHGNFQSL